MLRLILLLTLVFNFAAVHAQRIDNDIFGNLIYESRNKQYSAKLEKNIFDDLIFTDSKGNKIKLEKKYLDREHRSIHKDADAKLGLFNDLIREYRRDSAYSVTYKIDIFDKLIIEDNRGYKLERGKDIFGHEQYKEEYNGIETSIKRNIHGALEYRSGSENASLKKDIFDRWSYEDSFGNKFQFGQKTWEKMIKRHRSDEEVFRMLINQFFTY